VGDRHQAFGGGEVVEPGHGRAEPLAVEAAGRGCHDQPARLSALGTASPAVSDADRHPPDRVEAPPTEATAQPTLPPRAWSATMPAVRVRSSVRNRSFPQPPSLPRRSGRDRRPEPVSATNVAQPSPVTGFCDRGAHGPPARLRPRLHHRPTTTPPSRRARARRLLPSVHRDRQRRRSRPPVLEQVLDQLRPATPGRLEARPPRPLPAPPGRHRDDARRNVGFRSLQEQVDSTSPGGKLVFHVFAALAEFERDLIRARTSAGLAAARPAAAVAAGPR
jgi:hypothetical protein